MDCVAALTAIWTFNRTVYERCQSGEDIHRSHRQCE
jgi:hypothetical protein